MAAGRFGSRPHGTVPVRFRRRVHARRGTTRRRGDRAADGSAGLPGRTCGQFSSPHVALLLARDAGELPEPITVDLLRTAALRRGSECLVDILTLIGNPMPCEHR